MCVRRRYIIPLISDESVGRELPQGLLTITAVEAEHVPRMVRAAASGGN